MASVAAERTEQKNLPFSRGFFPNAQDFDIAGGEFADVGRDQTKVYNIFHVGNGNERGNRTGNDQTSVTEPSNRSKYNLGPPKPKKLTDTRKVRKAGDSCDTYIRNMRSQARGTPLWSPGSSKHLSEEYRKRGVAPGDVGIITLRGDFDFLFSICHSSLDPINKFGVPDNFELLEDLEISIRDCCNSMSHIASLGVEKSNTGPYSMQFGSFEKEGAILVLPFGDSRQDALDMARFREYGIKHAKNWYAYAIKRRKRIFDESSLYLVTGCDNALTWGIAAFTNVSPQNGISLKFIANPTQPLTWEQRGPGEVKVGPMLPPDHTSNSSGNQSVFLRGFTVSVRKLELQEIASSPSNGPRVEDSTISEDPKGSLSRGIEQAWKQGVKLVNMSTIFHASHPAELINKRLLEKVPTADIAITHDGVWCTILRNNEDALSGEKQMYDGVRSLFEFEYRNGAVYVVPKPSMDVGKREAYRAPIPRVSAPKLQEPKVETPSLDSCPSETPPSEQPKPTVDLELNGFNTTPRKITSLSRRFTFPDPSRKLLEPVCGSNWTPRFAATHTDETDYDFVSTREIPQADDIIIAVMGPTGAGKSTFVNRATGNEHVIVGHQLESCTTDVFAVRYHDPESSKNFVFVDTPGFDDTNMKDTEILQKIATWLKITYQSNVKLTGLLFLHRISDNRMGGTPLRNLKMFEKLCGKNALQNICLVTTMWSDVDSVTGDLREADLCENYWATMISRKSRVYRFEDTKESAWSVIKQFVSSSSCVLQIQREMVDEGKELPYTSAGTALHAFLIGVVSSTKRSIQRLEDKLRKLTIMKDDISEVAVIEIVNKIQEQEEMLAKAIGQQAPLKRKFSLRAKAKQSFAESPQNR